MKMNKYLNKSLSKRFIVLMGSFLLFFLIGAATLLIILHEMNKDFINERNELNKKEKIALEINSQFNQALFDGRGYLAFGNKSMKDNALSKEPKIRNLMNQFEKIASTDEDQYYFNTLEEFSNYYFSDRLPEIIHEFKAGNDSKDTSIANNQVTEKVVSFQKSIDDYSQHLDMGLENHFQKLMKMQTYMQIVFILFIIIIFFILLRIMLIMFHQIGQPLSQLAGAANQIASENETPVILDTKREDEIGVLSKSFQKMAEIVQKKEQDLMAQNEELIAQQEELQAQQLELEDALQLRKENEEKLKIRNSLVNGISNSLNKKEVLESIVVNFCKILSADKGIIAVIADDSHASLGITESGVNQFISQLKNGLFEKLVRTKEPFAIKREVEASEKGYHEGTMYCYDLYLPVFSSDDEIIAVMVFTRFGSTFLSSQMEEFKALSKSIGISLDKIFLFQHSEEERKRNQDILNTLQEGVQLIDVNGTTLQTNDHLCKIFGCVEHSLIGMTWGEWTSYTQSLVKNDNYIDNLKRMIAGTEMLDDEDNTFIFKLKNQQRVIKIYSRGIFHGLEKLGTILVYRDITKEFEVDQIKSEFVSTVSHELRTPLSSILGFTELMLTRNLNQDRQNKYLTTIFNETKRLTALINDFLDVQRMEAGKQTYEKKYIELLPILRKIIEAQQVNTNQHEIILETRLNRPVILGDKIKVEQVFLNLINNAVKYSPDGGTILVKVFQVEKELKVQVIDQGLGIPEDSLEKLFTKFYRVDNTDRRRIGGTGLGLAIVQEIMKAHNGKVTVQSQFGNGSTFSVIFPAIKGNENFINKDNGKVSGDSFQILLIEDDPSLVELISQELKENGYQITWFKNGKTAIQYLQMEVPDAIVLDILLEDSEIDGWGIMEELKQNDRLKEIPIIISSALDEREKGLSFGAMNYLVKPYKPSDLSKTIMQTLLKKGHNGQILIPDQIRI
jgi:PAS domain S-box-containing protein